MNGWDNLAGNQAKKPLAPVEALGEGGGEADQAGEDAGDTKVEDVEVARVAMSFPAWGIVCSKHFTIKVS